MQYRLDPKTGNQLSVLGFGCMRLPSSMGRPDQSKSDEMFQTAIDNGVNYFDTAYLYGGSEAALGDFLSRTNQHDKIHLATKLPLALCRKTEDFEKFLNTQLERLKTDSIEYYLMHMITSPDHWQKMCDLGIEQWLLDKQAEGKIKHVGFSYHGTQDDFVPVLEAYDWDFCQIQYNYLNINYQAGAAGLKRAHEKGLGIIVMEPLLGGKLAENLPTAAQQAFSTINAERTPVGWALNWLWDQEEVTVTLSGMSSLDQVKENIALASEAEIGMISGEERNAYELAIEAFSEAFKVPCTGCNYCMPCPSGVDIPGCFTAYNSSYTHGRIAGIVQHTTGSRAITANPSFASNCTKCGLCETKCPQNIEIVAGLQDVKKRLEPWWYRAALSIARRFTA